MLKKCLFVCLILMGVGIASGLGAQDVKIGVIYPLSGPMALVGQKCLEGSEVARVEQNEKGGVLGKKIEYVVADAPDAKAAVAAAERLININKVDIILGTYSSSLSFAATNVTNKYGKVYWEVYAISDDITSRGFKYVFRTGPTASMMSYAAVRCMAENMAPKLGKTASQINFAAVYEDSLFGSTTAKYGIEAAKKLGMKVVADESYNAKTTDLTPVILRLKAANPDFLLYPGYMTDQMLFFRQAKEHQFHFKAVIGTGGVGLDAFGEGLGIDADGIGNIAFIAMNVKPTFAKGFKEFMDLHQKVLKKPATDTNSIMTYAGTKILFMAMQNAKSTDPEAVRNAAIALDVPAGGTENGSGIKFDPKTGQNSRAVTTLVQWQEGGKKQNTVWPEEAAIAKMIFPFPKWDDRKKK
jgi:branched-chain amino acid transport system substrate-binding protein